MRLPSSVLSCLPLLAALSLASAAEARKKAPEAPPPPPQPSLFAFPVALMVAGFDRDGDGFVSRAEYDEGVARSFPKDGEAMSLIDLSRWAETHLGHAGALPGQFDFDRDGDERITRAEYVERFRVIFTELDADKDGRISRRELLTIGSPCRVTTPPPAARKR